MAVAREPLTGAERTQLGRLKALAGGKTTQMLVLSDIGRDHDDEVAFLQLASLQRMGIVNVTGVVTNYGTPDVVERRADLAAGLLDSLGMGNVPVAAGSSAGKPVGAQDYEFQAPYAKGTRSKLSGLELMKQQLAQAPDHSITLLVIAGMTDVAELAQKFPDLVRNKVRDVTVMGGATEANGTLAPDSSFNDAVDLPSAKSMLEGLRALGVKMTFVTRHAASGAQIDMGFYNDLAATGGAAGARLQKYQHHALQHLFERVNMPPGDPKREGLPDRADRAWFLKTFTSAPPDYKGDDFWPMLKGLNPYDPLAVLAGVPGISEALFDAQPLGTTGDLLIGPDAEHPGIKPGSNVQLSLRALGKMALLLENGHDGPHVKARTEAPPSYPKRSPVSDGEVSWSVAAPGYRPGAFTSPIVIENDETKNPKGWADPATVTEARSRRTFTSLVGPVQWGTSRTYKEDGKPVEMPLNPHGRTGIEGRGLLGRFGANAAGDAIVTRKNPETGELELLAIRRKDTAEWAMPGGMQESGESPFETISRELKEEAGVQLDFHRGTLIYQGYVDDPRNTDHAWMETSAVHLQLTAEEAGRLSPRAGDDAVKWRWMPLNGKTLRSMYSSHADIVRRMLATSAPAAE